MMERFCKWLDEWEATEDDEIKLHSMLDSLDDIVAQLIGDCIIEGIDASEIQVLLAQHRRNSRRLLNIRMDVPEKLDWITKKIAAERYHNMPEADEPKGDTFAHPIFAFSDNLMRQDAIKWKNRPDRAREFMRLMSGTDRKAAIEKHVDAKVLETHLVNLLRNHKDKLLYP